MAASSHEIGAGTVVVLSADDPLRQAVVRLAALAGTDVDAAVGGDDARAAWGSAALVVVGSDVAERLATTGLPRREGVVIATADEPGEAIWRAAVGLGADAVVSLPSEQTRLVDLITDAVEVRPPQGATIAVIGGCGGAGASTLAAGLAVTASRLGSTVLIDADPYAGGLDLLIGAEQRPGARWPDLVGVRGRLPAAALGERLVMIDRLALLSFDRSAGVEIPAEASAAVAAAACRGFSWVVADLPRHLDPAASVLARSADLTVLVVPCRVRATAAASMLADRIRALGGDPRLAVRTSGSGELSGAEMTAALGLPLIATIHSEPAVAVAAERGEPPLRRARGSLADACRAVLSSVAAAPARARR